MLLPSSGKLDATIATLGPRGTDAHAVAAALSDRVLLFDSFRESLENAERHDCIALVPCGCGSFDARALDRWVDLHFQFGGRLSVLGLEKRPTKRMCAAVHRDAGRAPASVGLHPATQFFARKYFPNAEVVAFETKIAAAEACAAGRVDACIGTLDIVRTFGSLRVLDSFDAEMIWILYGRPEVARHLARTRP